MAWSKAWWSNLLRDTARTPDLCGPNGLKFNNFDLIRFLMAVAVIFSHSYPIVKTHHFPNGTPTEPLLRVTHGHDSFGGLAVNVFFILSGFLITMSWERSSSILNYLKRRVFRIYPGFIVAMLFCAVVIAPLFTVKPYNGLTWPLFKDWAFSSMILQEHWVPGVFLNNPLSNALNSSVWTIRFEFGCYLLVLLLGVVGLLRSRLGVLVFFAASNVAMVGQRWYGYAKPDELFKLLNNTFGLSQEWFAWLDRYAGPLVQWPGLVTFFAAGAFFYKWRDAIPKRLGLFVLCFGTFLTLLLSCADVSTKWGFYTRMAMPVLLPLTLGYSIFWLAFQPYLSFPRFAKYGDFSYGIYLYAFPVQQALKMTMGDRMGSAFLNFALATPITFVLAVGSWYGVERYFIKRKHKEKKPGQLITPTVTEAPIDPAQQAARSY
jgi:peptidoglycan/LPS O-acetylase OafA/YrhL